MVVCKKVTFSCLTGLSGFEGPLTRLTGLSIGAFLEKSNDFNKLELKWLLNFRVIYMEGKKPMRIGQGGIS